MCINGGFLHGMWTSWKNTLKWHAFFSPFLPLVFQQKKVKANWRPVFHDKLRPLLSTQLFKFSSKWFSTARALCFFLAWVITFIPVHRQVGSPYIANASLRADEHFLNQTERSRLENVLSLTIFVYLSNMGPKARVAILLDMLICNRNYPFK